uniref:Glycoside hydrolase family 5 domain-containing protein n=1 Tax=Thermodesulfobacterium geofontis TaxID=1295609 RepID=A0A7V5XFB8_9BACT
MKVKKYFLLVFSIFLTFNIAFAQETCPLIGAIRWDAWHGKKGNVGVYVEKVLSNKNWHYRLPFCATINNDGKVEIDCVNENVISKEADYAKAHGINFWAFLAYEPDSAMSLGLKIFTTSKQNYNFALIIEFSRYNSFNFRERNRYLVSLIKHKNYLLINNRPVIFIFNINDEELKRNWKNENGFRIVIEDLITKLKDEGINKPYFVIMDFQYKNACYWANIFDFDAISTYATHPNKPGSYDDLVNHALSWWESAKTMCKNKTVVPIVMTGWDPRPRAETPAPWQKEEYIKKASEIYFETPKPEEIADAVGRAVVWAKQNKSPLIIIYAWNEFDEGGWIMPTLMKGDARLKAIGELIKRLCNEKNSNNSHRSP